MSNAESERLRALYSYETALYAGGCRLVVGVDEVGRGAVAGPVSAGACILGPDADPTAIPYLNDSKKLTPRRRESAASAIKEHALAWHVAHVPADVIDATGIVAALQQAMRAAVSGLAGQLTGAYAGTDPLLQTVLLDGRPMGLFEREQAIVKGDGKVAAIAAASVLAKVERDALMCDYDVRYPGYGFADHKGYAAAAHVDNIVRRGLSEIHRKSFCGNFFQGKLF
ncbi:MAG: ribonuclease HII [Actinomycetes bacterium]|jgi:ribonuclease HII|nr:ribonuclease HII [Actinomycetes bacterium]